MPAESIRVIVVIVVPSVSGLFVVLPNGVCSAEITENCRTLWLFSVFSVTSVVNCKLRSRTRQRERERRASSDLASHREIAAHGACELTADREPEAEAMVTRVD